MEDHQLISKVFKTAKVQIEHALEYPTTYSGILLVAFLITHSLGNLKTLIGRRSYNLHGYMLHSQKGFEIIELLLATVFSVHIVGGLGSYFKFLKRLWNSKHGGMKKLHVTRLLKRRQTKAAISGLLILMFLRQHILDFRARKDTCEMKIEDDDSKSKIIVKDIFGIGERRMKQWRGFVLYMFSFAALAYHLNVATQPALVMRLGLPLKSKKMFLEALRGATSFTVSGFVLTALKLKTV